MSIAYRLREYLEQQDLPWHAISHRQTSTASETAHAALIPESRVAKSVVLEDDSGYVLAVIGSNHTLDVDSLSVALGRNLRLASEQKLAALFHDCLPGAVPPVGSAYGVPTVWDDSLGDRRDIYFEAGDHRTLVHMTGEDFRKLMRDARPLRYYVH